MKKLLFALVLLPVMAFANTTTSMRTPSGDLVQLGDSESSLIQKMGKPRPNFYVLNDGKLHCAATEYTYRVDLQEYKVIICRGNVVKILWKNL